MGDDFVIYGITPERVRASQRNQAALNANNNYFVKDGAHEVAVEAVRNQRITRMVQKKFEFAKQKNDWPLPGELPAAGASKKRKFTLSADAPPLSDGSLTKQTKKKTTGARSAKKVYHCDIEGWPYEARDKPILKTHKVSRATHG